MKSHSFFTTAFPRQPRAASGLLWALLSASPWALAQTGPTPEGTLGTVTVKPAPLAAQPSALGLTDDPPSRTPLSLQTLTEAELKDLGVRRLSDALQLDASASDAYNAVGYWDYVTLRGFVIDPVQNYRRDGLPISAETSIGLENKESIDLLKGTSGMQAGTSAPGGLVNFTVKRPTENNLRQLRLETTQHGGSLAHVDLGGRFGADRALGYRLNLASERIQNHVPGADGDRHLAALAMDWRLQPGSLLEVELEHSRRSQPSVPGQSLLGDRLPVPEPRLNINSQPWSRPTVMQGLSGSVRYEQAWGADWRWSAHASRQRLKTNDFLAYPYGCEKDGWYDRYCANGDFDLYDYRSVDETRRTDAFQWQARGDVQWGGHRHQLAFGVMRQKQTDDGHPQADNYPGVGTGNVFTLPALPENPSFTDPYTLRTDHSTEWFAHDRVDLSNQFTVWAGWRHSQLNRRSVRTDGSRATAYRQRFNTPWLALGWQATPDTLAYVSAGQGIESLVTPGRSSKYTNAGQPLPPLKSRQWEWGLKQLTRTGEWGVALYQITRPRAGDAPDAASGLETFQLDGDSRHRGLELNTRHNFGPWTVRASAAFLRAERRNGTIDPSLNGQAPVNVPNRVLRMGVGRSVASVPGLAWQAHLSHEGPRRVLADGSITLPAWTTLDASLSYRTQWSGVATTWRLGVANLTDKRYFKESPNQYGHVYLFPGAPRTWRLGADFAL